MRKELPEIVRADEWAPLVIRTDYTDHAAWGEIVAALARAVEGERDWEAAVHFVEDRRWDGVTGDEALAAAARDEELSVVFLADEVTMRSPLRPLLALDLGVDDDEDLDPVYYQELIGSPPPREVRVVPEAVHMVHGNLQLANVDFAEFVEDAAADPDGVLRDLVTDPGDPGDGVAGNSYAGGPLR
ncbi:hypothetical protein BF14_019520 [Streptomyces griseus]|uniref:DUF6924 domain-containing protein n=1 Tax=Streptomyces globisporus TaxID=1908 RepID=UPI0005C88773|nr:hypothetical protein [Streptomyces globisporus]AWL87824.1 hypothetical protein DIJ69_19515 [Streptomyces globisporus]PPA41691.1 hypothetical protein BF14_019520 [Streptomyces griseus]RAN19010.1 hypothetical protein A3838_19030 [Streptomyces badius]RAN26917.1 hypothetical protein A3800_19040 [Streptomyces badius]